jgi:hypothetical protein
MSDDYKKQIEMQRRAFEAQFGSLESMGFEDKTKREYSDEKSLCDEGLIGSGPENSETGSDEGDENMEEYDSEEEDEFRGFDAPEEPKVVRFKDTTREYAGVSKQDQKLLKSGKASLKSKPIDSKLQPKTKEDKEDLEKDLELQRFLSESNILQQHQKYSGADLLSTLDTDNVVGKARRHTLRSRMDELSSTNGANKHKLEKMPMSFRKGMIESHKRKITQYEQDAKDGGIILSRVKKGEFRDIGRVALHDRIGKGQKTKSTYRQKGLKIHSVGRSTRNGLVISQRDIDRINGSGTKKGKGKRR